MMWATGFQRSPSGRAERLIATLRVVLAATSLFAIWLDPSEPSKYANTAYTLLVIYLVYALLMLLLSRYTKVRSLRLEIVTHVTDLAAFTLLLYFTDGPTSPFFVYYVFSLFCAAIRWQQRGTLWTALAVLALYTGQGVFTDLVLQDPEFELNRYIIRSFYLAVVALLLGYLTTYEQRTRRDLGSLAAWPHLTNRPDSMHTLIHETLAYAAKVMQTPKTLLLWDEAEEPYRYLAFLSDEAFQWLEENPNSFDPPVAEDLSGVDFLCLNASSSASTDIICNSTAGFQSWHGTPLHPELQTRFRMDHSLSLVLRGEQFAGRLFFIGKKNMTDDDLSLGGLVARQVESTLSRFYLQQRLQQAASMEARMRLARDLHDGLLQSLTGIALQLELVRRMPDPVDEGIRKQLDKVQELIVEEQRALRTFIQQLKPLDAISNDPAQNPLDLLAKAAASIERRWGVKVQLSIEPVVKTFTDPTVSDIRYLLHEALSNSAKHAHASMIQGLISLRDGHVCITVSDNGRGFPFKGRHQLDELVNMQHGPRSLKERIITLGGQLTIESETTGSVVVMTFPVQAKLLKREQPENLARSEMQIP